MRYQIHVLAKIRKSFLTPSYGPNSELDPEFLLPDCCIVRNAGADNIRPCLIDE
jgi:hypothetical protein